MNLEKALLELVLPIVSDKQSVSVKEMTSLNENEILLYVYAMSEDVARLIGRQGSMATALRNVMAIATRVENKRISIKFEAY
jgi:predicted RNA-binding protein YlqC (UPF0109 family)